jgi:hypothetical protein
MASPPWSSASTRSGSRIRAVNHRRLSTGYPLALPFRSLRRVWSDAAYIPGRPGYEFRKSPICTFPAEDRRLFLSS